MRRRKPPVSPSAANGASPITFSSSTDVATKSLVHLHAEGREFASIAVDADPLRITLFTDEGDLRLSLAELIGALRAAEVEAIAWRGASNPGDEADA